MLVAAVAAGLLLAQAAAPAAPAPQAKPPVTVSDKAPEKPKLICEREKSADSFISKRVCRTPEEVEAMRKAGNDQARNTQEHYQQCWGVGC